MNRSDWVRNGSVLPQATSAVLSVWTIMCARGTSLLTAGS